MAALQDTTALISELTTKLAELDGKVAGYRLDMATKFTKISEEVLRNVPGDVAYRVSQAITTSLQNYPSLYPPGSLSSTPSSTPTSSENKPPGRRVSPPPILPHTSRSPKDAASLPARPREPHDREVEFQGLFIPTYLPLLEKVDRPQHLSPESLGPAPTSPGSAPASLGPAPASSDPVTPEAATVDHQRLLGRTPSSETSRSRRRPSPLRRGTNTSIDSTVSDSSSVRTVKSALRRLSGSSRPPDSPRDPRRVRFDFEGQEVLPSSSPENSPTAPPQSADKTLQAADADDDSYITSLGDIKGEEEDSDLGLPKKVSSTQALRALSKAPLDEGTVWTIVNTESASETLSSSDTDKVRSNTATNSKSPLDAYENTMDSHDSFGQPKRETYGQIHREEHEGRPSQPLNVQRQSEMVEEDDDSDDEANVLFMGSRKGGQKPSLPASSRTASAKSISGSFDNNTPAFSSRRSQASAPPANNTLGAPSPNALPQPIRSPSPIKAGGSNQATGAAADVMSSSSNCSSSSSSSDNDIEIRTMSHMKKVHKSSAHSDNEDDTFFDMDEEGTGAVLQYLKDRSERKSERREKRVQKHLEKRRKYNLAHPNENDDEAESADLSTADTQVPGDDLPHSPPIQIGSNSGYRPVTPEFKVPDKVPSGHPGGYPVSTSIGTYDGKPITPHVVKNKALRDQLKNAEGEVPFFVGSVNGNSGVDASNVKSYQASVMNPSTPNGGFASGSFAERLMWEKATGVNYGSDEERWGVKKPADVKKPGDVSYGSPGRSKRVERGFKPRGDKSGDIEPSSKNEKNAGAH